MDILRIIKKLLDWSQVHKVLESIVRDQMLEHLAYHYFLSDQQHRFMRVDLPCLTY